MDIQSKKRYRCTMSHPMKKTVFASKCLAASTVNTILAQRGVGINGLRALKVAGVKTLLDFDEHASYPNVSDVELELIRSHIHAVEIALRNRLSVGTPQNT